MPAAETAVLHAAVRHVVDAEARHVADDDEPQFTADNPLAGEISTLVNLNGSGSTRETCHVVARLDMPGAIKSLNVSNAAVLALYIGASRLGFVK